MSREAEIEEKVEELLRAPVGTLGFQLLDVQYRYEGRWILRLLIDKPEGVGIDDCSTVSELAGRILEVEDPVPSQFSLEVSSPGIFRKLKRPRDYRQAIGKIVRLSLVPDALEEGKNQILRGTVTDATEETLMVESEGNILELPMDSIRKARLDPDL